MGRVSSKVNYSIECLPEDTSPRDHFEFPDQIEWVEREIEKGNEWGWCLVKVTAERNGIEGTNYLGACSYKSEKDFKRGGYWTTMKKEAFADLEDKEAAAGITLHKKRRRR